MRIRWIAGLLALLLCAAAAPVAAPARLLERLAQKESQLAELYAEFWRAQYRVALGEPDASTLDVRERIRKVLTEPELLDALSRTTFEDRLAERRRRFFLEEAADSRISADPELAALVEELEKIYAAARFDVGGNRLTRADLNTVVAREPDREKRRQAWEARAQLAPLASDRVRKAMVLRQKLAQRFAGETYPEFLLRRNQVDRRSMLAWFEEIRRETQPEFERLSARMRRELGIETLEPWDIDFFFGRLSGDSVNAALPRDQAWPRVRDLARSLGYDLAGLPVELKVAEIAFGGGTYPIRYGREVRILVNAYDGLTFTDTLLHEAGHALHYVFDDEPTFLLLSNYAQPFDEGLGQVMSLLLYRAEASTRFFGLTAEQVRGLREAYRLGSLFDLRQRIASSLFEFEAYASPGADLPALYDRLFQKHVGVSTHGRPVWTYNPFYATGPIYQQSYVLAEMVGRQIHDAVDLRFGRAWGPEAGAYLRTKFFRRGGSLTLDEILTEGTGRPLSAAPLIAALKEKDQP
jgi:oligoendopeptidase F